MTQPQRTLTDEAREAFDALGGWDGEERRKASRAWGVEAGRGLTYNGVRVASLASVVDGYGGPAIYYAQLDNLVHIIARLLNASSVTPDDDRG